MKLTEDIISSVSKEIYGKQGDSYYKNDLWWYPGRRKLQPVPYKYIIPDLWFLTGTEMKKVRIVEIVIKPVHSVQGYNKKANELF